MTKTLLLPHEFDDADFGPAMRGLTDRMQNFVIALVVTGSSYTDAAAVAGYSPDNRSAQSVTGTRLAHDPRVQAAITELTRARLVAHSPVATQTLIDIMEDPSQSAKDRIAAAKAVQDRGGLPAQSEQKITVQHTMPSRSETIDRIRLAAKEMGLDPQKLLGYEDAVDTEFTEVAELTGLEGLEDLL